MNEGLQEVTTLSLAARAEKEETFSAQENIKSDAVVAGGAFEGVEECPIAADETLKIYEAGAAYKQETGDDEDDTVYANMGRRQGVDQHTDINLALLRRVKKISVELPLVAENCRRIHKVMLLVADFRHILAEAAGGTYGVASRPDLEFQLISFPTAASVEGKEINAQIQTESESIQMLFSGSRMAFIVSEKKEDELLLTLSRHRPHLGTIKEAFIKAGDRKLNVLTSAKQRAWRKFVYIYMLPLLEDKARLAAAEERLSLFEGLEADAALALEHREYDGGQPDEENSSDEDDQASAVKQKMNKKQFHSKHHHKNKK